MWEIKKLICKGDYDYALVSDHPKATNNGYVLYHRIVMENYLGRLLNADEVVHHINHNKHDNRIENLQLMTSNEHRKMHVQERGRLYAKLKCPICGKIFEKPYNQTVYAKFSSDKSKADCCYRSCGCKLGRLKQLNRITHEVEDAISGNLLSVYKKNILQRITPRKP